tara:strand:- start:1314 stop:3356 length:2043 start_codon:yes stop_codon:yes gene_type:complete
MEFPLKRYNKNSIYQLDNGYYIDLKPGEGNSTIPIVKSPEGAIYSTMESITADNSEIIKIKISEIVSDLSIQLNSPDLYITDILEKKLPPLPPKNPLFKIIGKVVDKDNNPLPNTSVKLNLITFPEPSPNNPDEYTDFDTSVFSLPSILIASPFKSNDDGTFEWEYRGNEEIDFSKSWLGFTKEKYFPKSVGPKILKTGEETQSKSSSTTTFTGPTKVLSSKLTQSSDGTYNSTIELENLNNPGQTAIGTGSSTSGETAKKIATLNARKQFANAAPAPSLPTYTYRALINLDTIEVIVQNNLGLKSFTKEFSLASYNKASAIKSVKFQMDNFGDFINQVEYPQTQTNPKPVSPLSETEVIDLYDLGKIILKTTEINLDKEEAKLRAQVQKVENLKIEIEGKLSQPFEIQLTNVFAKQKENLKRTLFAALLFLLSKFGPNIVNNIISNVKDPLADKACPTPEELQEIINKRNKLVRQLNNIYRIVRSIANILNITNALIIAGKITFRLATLLPSPPFTPTTLLSDGASTLKRVLEKAGIAISVLTITAAVTGAILVVIIEMLKKLDFLIQECAEEINSETGEPNISFVEINDDLNNFIDPTTGEESSIVDPLTGNPLPYKGFTFEIKEDTTQNFNYPKRYAIARNIQGVQMLRSESSFASNPQILIEELKFAIDRDNLRAN